jgi:hypothetical protein
MQSEVACYKCCDWCCVESQSVLRAKINKQINKIKICKTLMRSVATYGAESWIPNEDIFKWLTTFYVHVAVHHDKFSL